MRRNARGILALISLATAALALAAASASAAPKLGVTLERDEGPGGVFSVVYHSDERVDFTATVRNEAAPLFGPPSAGEALSCLTNTSETNSGQWFFDTTIHYRFEFEWLRDGVSIATWAPATQVLEGEPTTYISTYIPQPADEGHAIQCLVKGTNGAGTGSHVMASQPVLVVNPQPAVAPPVPNATTTRRPAISGSAQNAGEKLTCTAPEAGWSTSNGESPITWSFEWMRNGVPLSPAHKTESAGPPATSEYELQAADLASKAVFQCVAKATNAGGHSALVESGDVHTAFPAPVFGSGEDGAPVARATTVPPVERSANAAVGPITLDLELPAGRETSAFAIEAEGWACEGLPFPERPATVRCSREDPLAPGQEYPPLNVVTALGADAPDLATVTATAFGGGAASAASAELLVPIEPALPFGLNKWTAPLRAAAGKEYRQAGGHPFLGESELAMNRKRGLHDAPSTVDREFPIEQVKQVIADLPPGVLGNQLALPKLCSPGVFFVCPAESRVGWVQLFLSEQGGRPSPHPIFAVEPEFGLPAEFLFQDLAGNIYSFSPRLRPEDGYAISLELGAAPKVNFFGSKVVLCDFGVKVEAAIQSEGECFKAGEAGANPKPLFTTPTRCGVPLTTRVRLDSWEHPTFFEGPPFIGAAMEGCDKVPFEPQADLQPTSHQADSPTGLDVNLSMPTEGLEKPDGIAQSNLREARVTFPSGMAVNPSAAAGLSACSRAQVGIEERGGKLVPNGDPVACPESSKIGSVEIETPVLNDTLKGGVYVARQGDIEGSLVGFYMVFDSPKNGILVKLPAKVTPNPVTGQLTVTVPESPQQPFSAVRMRFPGGPHATLLTPPKCGSYQIKSELVPWSGGPTLTLNSPFQVEHGPGGGGCPSGGLEPSLSAGSTDPLAGSASPFNVHLTRPDGSDRFTALNLRMPPGISAFLKGVPYCPDSVLAAIPTAAGTGQGEIDRPSCPPASQIGTVLAGAGAGPNPFFANGRAYLAGPYKGAPLSIVTVVPAVAGPLDLGNVVVRNALHVDLETAQVSVVSDPIPTILHGFLLDVRDIRVLVDRPHFTLNPTNCDPMAVGATVGGLSGASASLSKPFQVGGCGRLKFKPKLKLRLRGATRRSGHPALKAVVTYPKEGAYANIARAQVGLPHSEFLDQGNLDKVCKQAELRAATCPKRSIYGHAKAWTPLLDKPLEGPVYIGVGYGHKLPDLVADLSGQIRILLHSKVDTTKHEGIRSTFEVVPDAPVSRFVLEMKGGKKYGLLENSENICRKTQRLSARFRAQNGLIAQQHPKIQTSCKGKKRHAKGHHRHRRPRPRRGSG